MKRKFNQGGYEVKAIIVGIMVMVLVGCQSTQNSWHMENTVIKNTRVERYPAMFTAPYTKTLHQECPTSARIDATMYEGFDRLKFSECVTMQTEINGQKHDHWDQAFEPGTLNGMGGSIIQAGAILGGAAILANGYKQSGTRLNTHTNVTTNNAFNDQVTNVGPSVAPHSITSR